MCHVIGDDEGVTLIDAGLPGSRRRLVGALSALGRSPADIVRIVCTHGHPDHAGGVRELERDRTEVLMHAADIDGLSVRLSGLVRRPSRGRLFAYVTPTPRDARPLSDGQVLPVL
jgi:glyoxylase-like metal-dependent hydrolase (beta-lactamase superfamily II)